MFSGKTEELIRRVRRAKIAKQQIQVFKPIIDIRYDKKAVASHNGLQLNAIPITKANDILMHLNDNTSVIAIDEVQFFDQAAAQV